MDPDNITSLCVAGMVVLAGLALILALRGMTLTERARAGELRAARAHARMVGQMEGRSRASAVRPVDPNLDEHARRALRLVDPQATHQFTRDMP